MADILNNFLSSVFPVALMFFLGFWLARRNIFTGDEAAAILKLIARIAAPAILVSILVTSDFGAADLKLVGLYLLGEVLLYATTSLIGIFLFRLDFKNAILVGLAASFSNHVMFAYPIAQFAFPVEMTLPVRGIIAFDIILFALSIVILDIHAGAGRGALAAVMRQARNPLLGAWSLGWRSILRRSQRRWHLSERRGSLPIPPRPAVCLPPVSCSLPHSTDRICALPVLLPA